MRAPAVFLFFPIILFLFFPFNFVIYKEHKFVLARGWGAGLFISIYIFYSYMESNRQWNEVVGREYDKKGEKFGRLSSRTRNDEKRGSKKDI